MDTSSPRLPPLIEGDHALSAVRADPLPFLLDQARKLGDIFRYETHGWSTVVLNHPEYIKHVLVTREDSYSKLGTPDLMMLRPMLGQGLMTSDGPFWAEQRAMLRPCFDNQLLNTMVEDMVDATDALIKRWEARGDKVIDVTSELSFLTLQIVTRCLFGMDLTDESTDFSAAVQVQNEVVSRFDPEDVEALRKFQEASATISRIVTDIVEQRRARGGERADMLSVLSSARWSDGTPLSPQHIRDQIFTFLMAGHETTAKALSWTLYLLDQHPDVLERVRVEAQAVLQGRTPGARDVSNLTYTWMVLQEAMRIYPPVWLVSRLAFLEDIVGGYLIPAGSLVCVSPYVVHRHPQYWADPTRFDPERFLPQRTDDRDPHCYIPFGGGSRHCIGRRFAMLELRVALAMIVNRVRLSLVPGHVVVPEALVTLRPAYGLPMTATRIGS